MSCLPTPYYHDEDSGIVIYHGDCREILPHLPKVDLVLTDPPYGIGDRLVKGGSGHSFDSLVLSGANEWDKKITDKHMAQVLAAGVDAVVWGGNFYTMPPCDKPLCWDKLRRNQKNLSEWEYAWTSLSGRAQMFTYCGNGGFVAEDPREHPTQKPVKVMSWCLSFFPNAQTILDPFMGSGTTLVAAKQRGLKAIGIELEEKYCEIAVQRLAQKVLPLGA